MIDEETREQVQKLGEALLALGTDTQTATEAFTKFSESDAFKEYAEFWQQAYQMRRYILDE